MTLLSLLLTGCAYFFIAQYVVGPIFVKFKHRVPAVYRFPEQDWHEFLSTAGEKFNQQHVQLLKLGFEPIASSAINHVGVIFYLHPHDNTIAQLLLTKKFVGAMFAVCHEDGSRLIVSNTPMPSTYPAWKKIVGYKFPIHLPLEPLYNYFQRISANSFIGNIKIPIASELLAWEEEISNAQLDYMVALGYYDNIIVNNQRGLTWKGAYLISWRLAWPIKLLRLLWMHREAAAAYQRHLT